MRDNPASIGNDRAPGRIPDAAYPYGIAPTGFRLPSATRLGAVHLQVSDIRRSVAYYERVLGLRVLAQSSDAATLAAHEDDRPLVRLRAHPGVRPAQSQRTLGLYHFAILLPDRAALGRFVGHLTSIEVRAGMSDHAVSEAIYLTDPDGLGIEVYADRPRATWRYDKRRQLYMTTAPLDVRSLLDAGGNVPWSGMPAGTVLGHVHLHVGDLDAAAAFYHSALGFDKMVWEYPGALFLSAGGYHHHLGANTWASGPPAAPDQARLLSWDVVVPRADQAADAARSLEASGYPATEIDGAWSAVDPWGTPMRIVVEDQGTA